MPNINLDDAYILDETGEQVDKVTGLFTKDEDTTSGEKAFAQLNIGTAGSNRNLLDNPFFQVNQRGLTSYAVSNAYTVDRWKERGNATITVNSDGTLTITTDTSFGFQQTMSWMPPTGVAITVTALHSDGTVSTKTLSMPSSSYLSSYTNGISFVVNPTQKIFAMLTNTEVTLKAVKFELGSVSTLANDAPPEYGEELLKCMRYFQRIQASAGTAYIGTGVCFTSQAYCVVNLPVPLRTTSVTTAINGALSVQIPGSVLTASGQTFYVRTPSTIMIAATISGATAGQACLLALKDSGNYIDLSADL